MVLVRLLVIKLGSWWVCKDVALVTQVPALVEPNPEWALNHAMPSSENGFKYVGHVHESSNPKAKREQLTNRLSVLPGPAKVMAATVTR